MQKKIAWLVISLSLLIFLSIKPRVVQAVSMHSGGGIQVTQIKNPQASISHLNGKGLDGTFGGTLDFKISGTIDTSGTNWVGVLSDTTDQGFNMVSLIKLPDFLVAKDMKKAFDSAFLLDPDAFYALVGDTKERVQFTNTNCLLTYDQWKDPDDSSYPDTKELRNTLALKFRSDVLKGVWSAMVSLVFSGQDRENIPFELHFKLQVHDVTENGLPSDYTNGKALTVNRIPPSNQLDQDGKELNQFSLPIEVYSTDDQTYNHNALFKSSDLWIKPDQIGHPKTPSSSFTYEPLSTWSSYISPWDNGDTNHPLSNYNVTDLTIWPEVTGVNSRLPGTMVGAPEITVQRRLDDPTQWTNNYVNQRFGRVVNFHTHQVETEIPLTVTSKDDSSSLRTYTFTGRDPRTKSSVFPEGIPLLNPAKYRADATLSEETNLKVTMHKTPILQALHFSSGETEKTIGIEAGELSQLSVNAPTTNKLVIEEQITDEQGSVVVPYKKIDEQSLGTQSDPVSLNTTVGSVSKPGTYTLTYRVIDPEDPEQTYSNSMSITAHFDYRNLKTKETDTIYQHTQWKAESEITKLTAPDGSKPDFSNVKVTIKDQETQKIVDQVNTDSPGSYEITYSYLNMTSKTLLNVAASKASLKVKDISALVGTDFDSQKLFISATNDKGEAIAYKNIKITVSPETVDNQHAGSYKVIFDISSQIQGEMTAQATWNYYYKDLINIEDTLNAEMNFGKINFDKMPFTKSLDSPFIDVYDYSDPNSSKGWHLQVSYNSDTDTKAWSNAGMALTLAPTSPQDYLALSDITINDQAQDLAYLSPTKTQEKIITNKVQLNPTLSNQGRAPAQDYKATLVWNLTKGPE